MEVDVVDSSDDDFRDEENRGLARCERLQRGGTNQVTPTNMRSH